MPTPRDYTDPEYHPQYTGDSKPRVVYVSGNWPSKLVYWLLGGMMALNVAVAAAAISAVGGMLFDLGERMAVIETKMQGVQDMLRFLSDNEPKH